MRLSETGVLRAGSRPLRRVDNHLTQLRRTDILQNLHGGRKGKPDPYRVMLEAMRTNPIVHRVATAPAEVASLIDLYPVSGLKSGRPRRADPEGTPEERFAWSVWRQYVDDAGSQRNLIRRHMEAKLSTGSGVQIRYRTPAGREVFEFVQNVPWIIEPARGQQGWIWHPSPGENVPVIEAVEVFQKGFDYTSRAHSALMPLVDLLAHWELVVRALGTGARTDLLLGGIIAVQAQDDSWIDGYVDWIANPPVDGRVPWPMSYPVGAAAPVWIEGGGTIQDNLLKLHDLLLQNIARFCPMDAKVLLDGLGSGTHWNGVLLQRDNLQSFIWPKLQLEVLDDIMSWPFRPALANNPLGLKYDVDDWGIDGDWQKIINQPDGAKWITDLVKCGLVKQRALVGVGIDEADLLEPTDEAEWAAFKERMEISKPSPTPTDKDYEVGLEVFGSMPDHEADTSNNPAPTQRAELPTNWLEYGEW